MSKEGIQPVHRSQGLVNGNQAIPVEVGKRGWERRTLTVSATPSTVIEVSSNGDAGYISVSTEATASTLVPDEPVLPKKAPASPELPLAMVTTTPSSTRRDAISAHALVDQPPGLPTLAVIISIYSGDSATYYVEP